MGRAKAWLPIAGEPMLQRVVRILTDVVSPLVVVTAPGQDLPTLSNSVRIVHDEEVGRGPLQGLAAGLSAIQGHADAAYVSSCDVPFLNPAFVTRMIELLGESQICVPRVGEYHHPLAAVYRVAVLDAVRALLSANRMRPMFLFDEVPTRIVSADELGDVDATFESLRNLNTPEDYEAAIRDVELRKS